MVDNVETAGLDVECEIRWGNTSENLPGNAQVQASGGFGSDDSALVEIWTIEFPHNISGNEPTHNIGPNSFPIDYATGVSNPANGGDDVFNFHFTLPTTNAVVAGLVVEELNGLIDGSVAASNAHYSAASWINGRTFEDQPFSNSPEVFVPSVAKISAALLDADSDGYATWQEHICGTDPTNAASRLELNIDGGALVFDTATNRTYEIEGCFGLVGGAEASPPGQTASAPPAWQTVTNLPGTGSANTIPLGTNRFFRIRVEKGM